MFLFIYTHKGNIKQTNVGDHMSKTEQHIHKTMRHISKLPFHYLESVIWVAIKPQDDDSEADLYYGQRVLDHLILDGAIDVKKLDVGYEIVGCKTDDDLCSYIPSLVSRFQGYN